MSREVNISWALRKGKSNDKFNNLFCLHPQLDKTTLVKTQVPIPQMNEA